MYATLYQYLIFYKQLSLPGVGTLHLKRDSSQLDFGNKIFTAPAYSFTLDNSSDKPSKKLFEWLSQFSGVSDWDAVKMVNDFSFELKNAVTAMGEVNWPNVGVLKKDERGNIVMESLPVTLENEGPVIAEKVIREKPEHHVLVGETERSSAEMEELLFETATKKDYTWLIAIILTVAALMFVGWYFSEKGVNTASVGNQSALQTK